MEPRLVRFEGFEGIHLVADVWGDPDAWPVLLMHGGGQTRHAWGGTARTLAEHGWRAVSLDLRGHGDSEWALNGDYSFTAFSADCVAVADELGKPPVLVGASLGGVVRDHRRGRQRPRRVERARHRRHHPPVEPRRASSASTTS